MIIKVDEYFIQELNENGYDIDLETFTRIYKDSRKNPVVVKKRKRKELKQSNKKGQFQWNEEELEWVKITKEKYERLRKNRIESEILEKTELKEED